MKRVPFDPSIPTVKGGERQVQHLAQSALDEIIRKAAEPAAIEELVRDLPTKQIYSLSDGRLLTVWKTTGEVQIGCTKA